MHVIFRESHGLEAAAAPQDLGQDLTQRGVLLQLLQMGRIQLG